MIFFSTMFVLVLTTIVYYIHNWWSNREFYQLAEKFKGPPAFPLIGNLNLFFNVSRRQIFEVIKDNCRGFESPLRLWLGPFLVLNITKPTDIQRILNSPACPDKLYIYQFFTNQPSVLSAKYETSRIHKKLIHPYFDSNHFLRTHAKTLKEKSAILVERVQKEAFAGSAFDIYKYVSMCTLDSLCATLIGADVNTQSGEHLDFLQAINELLELIGTRVFNVLLHPDSIYRCTDMYRVEVELRRKISSVTSELMKTKRAKAKSHHRTTTNLGPAEDEQQHSSNVSNSDNFGEFISEKLRKEIEEVIVVGNEMTALTASFAILMLAIHPSVQDRVHAELKRVVVTKENTTYVEQLHELNYLEMAIKETMRLFPPQPFVVRKCRDNVDLPSGKVPKGAYFLIDINNLHRDPEIWGNDSNKFDPDRFNPLNVKYRHPYGYIPFGGGKRMCLGQAQAMQLIKIILVELVKQYRISTDLVMDDIRLEMGTMLKLKFLNLIKLSPR